MSDIPTKQIFNAASQQVEDATLEVDTNNEIVARFADGTILKFPADLTEPEFDALVTEHQTVNEGHEVITPAMEAAKAEQRAASEALINGSGNTMPDKEQVNASAQPATPGSVQ